MDKQLIAQKIESLRRCILRLQDKIPSEVETLANDIDLQDIVSLNLSRAVQLCVDIGAHVISEQDLAPPETMGKTFQILQQANIIDTITAENLQKAVGFRNIAVHNYERINWLIVHAIVHKHMSDFSKFAKQIYNYIEQSVR